MAQSLNMVLLIGNLGRDPEMRFTPNAQAVTNFSVATTRSWKKDDQWQEETEWHNVTVWGDKAERAAEQLRKGNKVFIRGRSQTREFDAKDGTKQRRTEVVADEFINLTGKSQAAEAIADSFTAPAEGFGAPTTAPVRPRTETEFDDLPF